ncbi:MAG: TolC family protein, partial [Alphaproteobacteria bacterium]|nr:TolC family protein [Alphaproteobacteria bacterium]
EETTAAAPLAGELEPLLRQAKEQNPELQTLRAQLRAARQETEAERASHYPTVSAVGYAGENPIRDHEQLNSNYAAAGITLSIPVFTGGRLSAIEKRAEYQARAVEQDLFDRENQIAREVRQSWNNTQTAYKNISVSEALRQTSAEALELTQARYDIGKSSIVDLAQAQLNQTQAEIAYSNATYEYLIQRALLDYKTGARPPAGG